MITIIYQLVIYVNEGHMAKKIILSVPDEMHEVLQRISKEEDKVIAAIVRRAISEHVSREYGIQIEHNVQRGGDQRKGSKEEE